MRFVLSLIALLLALSPIAAGKVSHNGWPSIDGKFVIHDKDESTPMDGTERSDKLLGGNGNDTIHGGASSDVLWASYNPSQSTSQVDRIWGGTGGDYIYASHGRNVIDAGPGNDYIHAHYGRGFVDCGPGRDLVYFSHKRRHGWKMRHCERVTYHAGTSTLTPNG
jgi:Ca2+-binding RTX toxin-like protein